MAKTNTARVTPQAAIKSFGKAAGAAAAESFLKEVGGQATRLGMFLVSIMRLDTEGRQSFRLTLQGGLDTARKGIKAKQTAMDEAIKAGATDEEVQAMRREIDLMGKTFNSQKVRVSEATMFARAVDKMHAPTADNVQANYHRAIAEARVFLREAGAGSNRGRKAKPAHEVIIETCKKLFEAGKIDADGLRATMMAINKASKGWTVAEVEGDKVQGEPVQAEVQARKVGPTQRKERKPAVKKGSPGFVPVKTATHDVPATHQ